VAGVTYPDDAGDPGDECHFCEPAISSKAFTPRADGWPCGHGICAGGSCVADRCYIDLQLVSSGSTTAGGCFSCQPDASLTTYTILPDATPCTSGGTYCQDGACAQRCLIDAGLIPVGTAAPNGCQNCDTANPQRWTSVQDGLACTTGGTFCIDGGCAPSCKIPDAGLVLGGTYSLGDPTQCCNPAVNTTGRSSTFSSPAFGLSYRSFPKALLSGNFNGPSGGRGLVVWDQIWVTVFLNPSDAGFEPQSYLGTSATPPVVADFDGDSFDDIAFLVDGGVFIFRGQPDGGPVAGTFLAGPDGAFALAVARSRGSTVPDLALLAPWSSSVGLWIFPNDAGAIGSGALRGQVDSTASSLVSGDFNGDGHYDLAAAGFQGLTILELAEGDAGLVDAGFWPTLGASYDAMSAGDLDGDGIDDLVVSYKNQNDGMTNVRQFRGSGQGAVVGGTFDAGLPLGWQVGNVSITRFSAQTLPGLVLLAGPDSRSLELLLQLSVGSTIDAGSVFRLFTVGGPASAVAAADFNGDGETDLVVGLQDGGAVVLWGQCP
jgi:hypothetical protein